MGHVSKTLAIRFKNVRKYAAEMRRQARRNRVRVPKDVKTVQEHVESGSDPLFAVYAAVQNLTSVFAENVSGFKEFEEYYDTVAAAQDEYLPSGPPMSPLTGSFFTTWAFFDLRFGRDKETIGTCMIDVSGVMEMDPLMVEALRQFQASRMGFYEHVGADGGKIQLRELLTDDEFRCHCPAGYVGHKGELWFVRLCPPVAELFDYHVTITTPYVLLGATATDWVAYLNRTLLSMNVTDQRQGLHDLLKYGPSVRYWPEFVFQAYHHHQAEAVFLTGLPDVSDSRPHAPLEPLVSEGQQDKTSARKQKSKKKQPRPKRPLPLKWEFDPDTPTYDFIKDHNLGDLWGLQEAVGNFLYKMEDGQFLAWEAVMAHEQGLPLTRQQQAALEELLDFTDGEEDRVLYINDVPRTSEPWFAILNKLLPHLLIEPFRTFDVHDEVQCEGWKNLARCLREHADGLSLSPGASSPLEVVPPEFRHKLWLQDCFDALSGLGQDEELTLEDPEQHYRIDEFIGTLRDHKDTVQYFTLTLDSLLERVILPERDRPIFVTMMQDKLEMETTADRIADHL